MHFPAYEQGARGEVRPPLHAWRPAAALGNLRTVQVPRPWATPGRSNMKPLIQVAAVALFTATAARASDPLDAGLVLRYLFDGNF